MKQLNVTMLLLVQPACGDDSYADHTAVYPVVCVRAQTTLPTPEPDLTHPPTPRNRNDAVAERIKAEIEAAAPVKAGGSYVLEFTKYNGGRLWIRQAAEADRVRGVFFKDPGATDILVYCPEPAMEYTCTVAAYNDEDGSSKTLLTVDLTEEYKALYPEAGITRAVRREYTSANAR